VLLCWHHPLSLPQFDVESGYFDSLMISLDSLLPGPGPGAAAGSLATRETSLLEALFDTCAAVREGMAQPGAVLRCGPWDGAAGCIGIGSSRKWECFHTRLSLIWVHNVVQLEESETVERHQEESVRWGICAASSSSGRDHMSLYSKGASPL
jgi:hypothetical protein